MKQMAEMAGPDKIRWTYAVALPGPEKAILAEFSDGSISEARLRELLGGDYALMELIDSTAIAYRKDQDNKELKENLHYPGLNGVIVTGKRSMGLFVGVLGTCS